MPRLWTALTSNAAGTAHAHADPRLRGRTYAIPFEDVWSAANALAGGGLRGWRLVSADDEEGVIRAEARSFTGRRTDDVMIRVGLDENGQTRVDVTSSARQGRGDWGRNARRIGRFFRQLDRDVVTAWRGRIAARGSGAASTGIAGASTSGGTARGPGA